MDMLVVWFWVWKCDILHDFVVRVVTASASRKFAGFMTLKDIWEMLQDPRMCFFQTPVG